MKNKLHSSFQCKNAKEVQQIKNAQKLPPTHNHNNIFINVYQVSLSLSSEFVH